MTNLYYEELTLNFHPAINLIVLKRISWVELGDENLVNNFKMTLSSGMVIRAVW